MTRRAPRLTRRKEIGEDLMKSRIVIVTTETLRRPFLRLENVAVAVCAPGPPRNVPRGVRGVRDARGAHTRAHVSARRSTLGVPPARNSSGAMFVEEVCIEGFKSYAQRTVVPSFDPLFIAITGLNGSGKSNILDSICFVLGITNLSQASTPRTRARDGYRAPYRADAAARRRGGGGDRRARASRSARTARRDPEARVFSFFPLLSPPDARIRPGTLLPGDPSEADVLRPPRAAR